MQQQQPGNSPQKGGFPPQQPGYPPQQGGYPPQQPGFPPQQGGYPPQQGGYPPQQGGYPPQQFIPQQTPSGKPLSGFERIANKDGLYIKQKIDIAEVFSGCERQNSYFIHDIDKSGEKAGVEIFRAKEESNCCVRQCLAGNCRPFRMHVQLRDTNLKVHNAPFLEIERPCTCTCYCLARPVVTVSHVEDGKRTHLGKIENPFKFCNCDYKMDVYNANNNIIYKIVAKCCQSGIMCNTAPCQPCQTVDFQMTTGGGLIVGALQKKTAGFCASLNTLADNFALTFPANASLEDKALLLAATLFADYQWFEKQTGCTF